MTDNKKNATKGKLDDPRAELHSEIGELPKIQAKKINPIVDSAKSGVQKDNIESTADINLREQVLPLCEKTQNTLRDLSKKFDQLMKFHKEQLDRGDVDYFMGKSRIDALENLEVIEKEMQEANTALQNLIIQIQQTPILEKPSGIKLGVGSATETKVQEEE